MPYVVLMPIFADKILHRGGQEFASLIGSHDLGAVRLGILMGSAGVGALLGALTLAVRSGVKGLGTWISVCCAGFGVSLMLFSFSKSFWLSVLLLMPVGYFIMLQMASSNTLIQVMVPDALRGRTMAVYSMMFMGMAPIGALLGGALSDRLGAPLTVSIGGFASVMGAWWFAAQLPKIRVEARKVDHCTGHGWRRAVRRDVDAGGGGVVRQQGWTILDVSECDRLLVSIGNRYTTNQGHKPVSLVRP